MTQEKSSAPIVWIGRFSGSSGYASATRGCYNALKSSGATVIGVDINTLNIVGDIPSDVEIFKNKDDVDLRFKNRTIVNAVIQEVPDRWGQVEFHGLVSLTGYTLAEIDQIPREWQVNLPTPHRLWTSSKFNVDIFRKHYGARIDIVYLFVDVEGISQSKTALNIDHITNDFRVLHIASNYNRKDTASSIKAYVRAFRGRNDTSLLIKLPARTSEEDIQKFIFDSVFPEVDMSDPDLPHIAVVCANLSDEEMWSLYTQVDVTISTERAKGFDLISAEAMAAGCPAIAIGWGANTEFMNESNSYILKPSPELVAVDQSLIVNEGLYSAGMWAAFDIDDASMALSDVYHNGHRARMKAKRGQEDVSILLGRKSIAHQMLTSFGDRQVWETSGFNTPRIRVWSKGRDRVRELSDLKAIHHEALTKDEANAFVRQEAELPTEYIEKRKPLWGKYGCVRPIKKEIDRMKGLKDKHLGQSIFVMGNGPSLKLINMDELSGVPTFAANRISLAFDKTRWRPTYFTALDWLVTPDNHEEYSSLPDEIVKLFPWRFHGLLNDSPNTYWYESTSGGMHGDSKFQTDASLPIRGAGTVVTAMLQLAWHLGFRQMYLLGCNANYVVPSTVKQSGGDRFGTGNQIHLESTEDDDANHFDPRYFGAGKKWHDPNVDEMKRGFRTSQLAIERMGGKLVDCTEGGKLDFLPKLPFSEALELVRSEGK